MDRFWSSVIVALVCSFVFVNSETCSGTCSSRTRYTTRCGMWSRCTRYRTTNVRCSCTYRWVNSGQCTKPCGTGTQRQMMSVSGCSSGRPTSCNVQYRNIPCNTHRCSVNGGWSGYGSWANSGSCSVSCGTGVQKQVRSRSCTNPRPAYGGRQCSGSSTEQRNVQCSKSPCPVNGGWSSYGSWRNSGSCSVTCGTGQQKQIKTRSCTNPSPAYGGASCSGLGSEQRYVTCTKVACPVNGGWSGFGSWTNSGSCSVTCGTGLQKQTRTRSCTNPRPNYGGRQCTGSVTEERNVDCTKSPCPVNGGWSEFSLWRSSGSCTVTCGNGVQKQTKVRSCTNPIPAYGGRQCSGSTTEERNVDCTKSPCPINGGWTTYGTWMNNSDCSVTCASGTLQQIRHRQCTNPRPAYGGETCSGTAEDRRNVPCVQPNCPVNGGWSDYTSWTSVGQCSVSCGVGQILQQRSRSCTNPPPAYGGQECIGDELDSQHIECNLRPCPINGGWGEYNKWSMGECTASCGEGVKTKSRSRECNNPEPQYDGEDCIGDAVETEELLCSFDPCPINGGWSDWTEWEVQGKCSKTCETGELVYTKTRICNNPKPRYGGTDCQGKSLQRKTEFCNSQPCPVDGGWGEWQEWRKSGKCSKACGEGEMREIRTRECNNPQPKFGGEMCYGYSTENRTVECFNRHCSIDGGWSVWTEWETDGICSVTCGAGQLPEKRTRLCNNPKPQHGGMECFGVDIEKRIGKCFEKKCPGLCDVDGYMFSYEEDFTKYFKCHKGLASLTKCPANQKWDDEKKSCVRICPFFSSDKYDYPNDCSKFVQCMWGFPIISLCPTGTAWSQGAKHCLHEDHVECGAS